MTTLTLLVEVDKAGPVKAARRIAELKVEIERLTAERDALKQQAQCWAQEAKAQKATVYEAYRVCTGNTGETGDWNGAEPIRALAAERDRARTVLRQALEALIQTTKPTYQRGGYQSITSAIAAIKAELPAGNGSEQWDL